VGTRVALGAGIGLLVSSRLDNDQRKLAVKFPNLGSTVPFGLNK